MRFGSSLYRLLVAAFLAAMLPGLAYCTSIRSGSGYGPMAPSYSACQTMAASNNSCIGYTFQTFNVNGSTYAGDMYFSNNSGTSQNLDLIQIGNVSSFSLPLNGIAGDDFGVFYCGSGKDSLGNALQNLACTADSGTAPTSSTGLFSVTQSGNSQVFTFDVAQPTGWVLFTEPDDLASGGTATVPTPEPASILLVLSGGLGLFFVLRRR